MRVLCSCLPGYGHLHPMVPLARALQAAGHEVAFATESRFCPRAEHAGFVAFPAGIGPGKVLDRTLARPDVAPPGPEGAWRFGAQMFAGVAAPAKVPDLMRAVEAFRPALVVHDVTDFAGPVAAAAAGLPWVAHSLGPLFPMEFARAAADLVGPLWEAWGVAPGPLGGMLSAPYLDICPASLQSPEASELGPVAVGMRPVPFDAVAGEALPSWAEALAPGPTVYVTLGTLDNDAPGVIEAAVEGVRDRAANVVVTVGPNRDPAELGPQPPHVHVERYLPQSALFPRCDLVVGHGGSGTTLAALAAGLPLLLLPQGANQFWNAERCAALGAGLRLLPDEVNPAAVAAAADALLGEPGFRRHAGRLAAEIAAMPPPARVVPRLEALAGAGPGGGDGGLTRR
ncbi:MAG: glycosyltransferase [Acidimicrobiales bacterium]